MDPAPALERDAVPVQSVVSPSKDGLFMWAAGLALEEAVRPHLRPEFQSGDAYRSVYARARAVGVKQLEQNARRRHAVKSVALGRWAVAAGLLAEAAAAAHAPVLLGKDAALADAFERWRASASNPFELVAAHVRLTAAELAVWGVLDALAWDREKRAYAVLALAPVLPDYTELETTRPDMRVDMELAGYAAALRERRAVDTSRGGGALLSVQRGVVVQFEFEREALAAPGEDAAPAPARLNVKLREVPDMDVAYECLVAREFLFRGTEQRDMGEGAFFDVRVGDAAAPKRGAAPAR